MTETTDIAKIEHWLTALEAQAAFEAEVRGWVDRAHSIRVALEAHGGAEAVALWPRLKVAVDLLSARPVDEQVYELPETLSADP